MGAEPQGTEKRNGLVERKREGISGREGQREHCHGRGREAGER